jgi:hypothetical protein
MLYRLKIPFVEEDRGDGLEIDSAPLGSVMWGGSHTRKHSLERVAEHPYL